MSRGDSMILSGAKRYAEMKFFDPLWFKMKNSNYYSYFVETGHHIVLIFFWIFLGYKIWTAHSRFPLASEDTCNNHWMSPKPCLKCYECYQGQWKNLKCCVISLFASFATLIKHYFIFSCRNLQAGYNQKESHTKKHSRNWQDSKWIRSMTKIMHHQQVKTWNLWLKKKTVKIRQGSLDL